MVSLITVMVTISTIEEVLLTMPDEEDRYILILV